MELQLVTHVFLCNAMYYLSTDSEPLCQLIRSRAERGGLDLPRKRPMSPNIPVGGMINVHIASVVMIQHCLTI